MLPSFVRPGQEITSSWANAVVSSIRSIQKNPKKYFNIGGGGGGSTVCAFGSLSGNAVVGGMVYCGDQNIEVPPYTPSLVTNRTKKLYFEIDCTVNMDDDNQILLPNVDTTTWSPTWEEGDNYPNNSNPTVPAGTGTVIVPLGTIVVQDNSLKFTPTGCGNITVTHCAGTLGHTRG